MYIAQNASRIARALFEIVMRRMWAQTTNSCLNMSKCIDRRMWPFNSPLRQLVPNFIARSIVDKIEGRQMEFNILCDMKAEELGAMFSCDGLKLLNALQMIPVLSIDSYQIKPITRTVLEVSTVLLPSFTWNDRLLGSSGSQRFWLFFENLQDNTILYSQQLLVTKKMTDLKIIIPVEFKVLVTEDKFRNQFQLRVASDSFVVDDSIVAMSLHNSILPIATCAHTGQ